MKARLVMNNAGRLFLLYQDGTIDRVDQSRLYTFLTRFNHEDACFCKGSYGTWKNDLCDSILLYPGITVAEVSDNNALTIYDFEPFMSLQAFSMRSDYITVAEFAKKYDKSVEMIKYYCRNGRIPGAHLQGRAWRIPADAEYPVAPSGQKPYNGPWSKEEREKKFKEEAKPDKER